METTTVSATIKSVFVTESNNRRVYGVEYVDAIEANGDTIVKDRLSAAAIHANIAASCPSFPIYFDSVKVAIGDDSAALNYAVSKILANAVVEFTLIPHVAGEEFTGSDGNIHYYKEDGVNRLITSVKLRDEVVTVAEAKASVVAAKVSAVLGF